MSLSLRLRFSINSDTRRTNVFCRAELALSQCIFFLGDRIRLGCHFRSLATWGLMFKPKAARLASKMPQSMHEYVVASLKECDIAEVAKATKISKWTLLKIRQLQIKNPGVHSIEPLYHYFKLHETKKRRAA